jgi:DNA-binding MarR family transcriptional regulator
VNSEGTDQDRQEPRWLDDREQGAWRSFIVSSRRLFALLDRELQQETDLPMSYYEILILLSEAPDRSMRMTELADATYSLPSRMSHAIGRLEKSGWVERRNCPSDRRGWFAVLTDAGFKALSEAAPLHVADVRRHLIDHLDERDLDDMRRVFGKLLDHLDAAGAPGPTCPNAAGTEADDRQGASAA